MDYQKVGLKIGLEVHQQLLTERKLFCRCPAGLYTHSHDAEVLRHMRPTLSELGEYDGTALMEFKTKKNIIYLLKQGNVCTYEMDDTPPFLVNQQAIDIAIEQCLMLGCDIVDEVHIARKQYLDGSIPTGFQRTAIVGVEGKLPFMGRELSITQVSVEEDSCREVSDKGHLIVWRTDRLGTPLIETVTGPDLRTPEEVEEAILLVGRVCRSSGHVRVGMGASRQDVNVSVRGGTRIEIKGVPKAGWAPRLVHGEATRQVNLLGLRDELHKRGFKEEQDILVHSVDVTSLIEHSDLHSLHKESWEIWVEKEGRRKKFELGKGEYCVRAVCVRGVAGTLAWPTQPERSFANELAGRVRVIAGLDQEPVLLHSENWPESKGSHRLLKNIRRRLRATQQDAVLLVWGPEADTHSAAEEIRLRYVDALSGVPPETRQPFADGSTSFERILPGPERMYPDTDSPPTRILQERVSKLRDALPEATWKREARYEQAGVSRPVTRFLIRRGGARLVDLIVDETGSPLRRTALFVGERIKGLRRAGVDVDLISDDNWIALFRHFKAQPVLCQAWARVVRLLAAQPQAKAEALILDDGLGQTPDDWQVIVQRAWIKAREGAFKPDDSERLLRRAIGIAMGALRGRVDVKQVQAALEKCSEETR